MTRQPRTSAQKFWDTIRLNQVADVAAPYKPAPYQRVADKRGALQYVGWGDAGTPTASMLLRFARSPRPVECLGEWGWQNRPRRSAKLLPFRCLVSAECRGGLCFDLRGDPPEALFNNRRLCSNQSRKYSVS